MKSVVLTPYCPLPVDSGGKSEIWKHLVALRELGPCRIASAARKPVGGGWTPEMRQALERQGFDISLREESGARRTAGQWAGLAYAVACKGLGLERAFFHANPYHRYAFPEDWWRRVSQGADLALINYSYWAWLPCECPKVLALHDLWSDYMWGGTRIETRDIALCDHVFAISVGEVARLRDRGVRAVSWCPPAIERSANPRLPSCALIGSANGFNLEGLRWIESAGDALGGAGIRVYGALAGAVRHPGLVPVGRYADNEQPYRENGIVLFATVQGMGLQIKTIEALAGGCAIVARRGAVRGLPPHDGAWIEVDTPAEAVQWIRRLRDDAGARAQWSERAEAFHARHLDAGRIKDQMRARYRDIAAGRRVANGHDA